MHVMATHIQKAWKDVSYMWDLNLKFDAIVYYSVQIEYFAQ